MNGNPPKSQQVVAINRTTTPDAPAPKRQDDTVNSKLCEAMFLSARKVEEALKREESRSRALETQLAHERATLRTALQEARKGLEEARAELGSAQYANEKLSEQVKALSTSLAQSKAELEHARFLLSHESKTSHFERENLKSMLASERERVRSLSRNMEKMVELLNHARQEALNARAEAERARREILQARGAAPAASRPGAGRSAP